MKLLVTRPLADAIPLARLLEAEGHRVVIDPLLEIRLREGAVLSLDGIAAVVFTSANGVRAFAATSARRDLPVYAVGDRTADVAFESGFVAVESADGDIDGLVALIRERRQPGDGAILHVRGTTVAGDLAGQLGAVGFDIRAAVLYEARSAGQFDPETIEALRDGSLDGVLLFSPRTARHFLAMIRIGGLVGAVGRLRAWCLSPAVAEGLEGLGLGEVIIANRPTQASLIEALRRAPATPVHREPPKAEAARPELLRAEPAAPSMLGLPEAALVADPVAIGSALAPPLSPAPVPVDVLSPPAVAPARVISPPVIAAPAPPPPLPPTPVSPTVVPIALAAGHGAPAEAPAARAPDPVAAPPRRKRRWVRRLVYLAIFLGMLGGGALGTQSYWHRYVAKYLPAVDTFLPTDQLAAADPVNLLPPVPGDADNATPPYIPLPGDPKRSPVDHSLPPAPYSPPTKPSPTATPTTAPAAALAGLPTLTPPAVATTTTPAPMVTPPPVVPAAAIPPSAPPVAPPAVPGPTPAAPVSAAATGAPAETATDTSQTMPAAGVPAPDAGTPDAATPDSALAVAENAQQGVDLLSQQLGTLSQRVDELMARPAIDPSEVADVATGIQKVATDLAGLTDRIAKIEARLDAKASRQHDDTIMVLSLGQVRDALAVGAPFAAPLTVLKSLAGEEEATLGPIATLEKFGAAGVPTRQRLAHDLAGLALAAAAPPPLPDDAAWWERIWDQIQRLVVVRRIDEGRVDTMPPGPDRGLALAQKALAADDLAGAVARIQAIEGETATLVKPWLEQAAGRIACEQAAQNLLAALTGRLGSDNPP